MTTECGQLESTKCLVHSAKKAKTETTFVTNTSKSLSLQGGRFGNILENGSISSKQLLHSRLAYKHWYILLMKIAIF